MGERGRDSGSTGGETFTGSREKVTLGPAVSCIKVNTGNSTE